MHFAVYITAGMDVNGNGRRGWLVYSARTRDYVGFVGSHYGNTDDLGRKFPGAMVLGTPDATGQAGVKVAEDFYFSVARDYLSEADQYEAGQR